MRIRTKLLLLLLSISLLPMLLLRCNNQRAASDMGHEIAARIRSQLMQRSSQELKQQVSDHAYVMLRERQLLEQTLHIQAMALEQLLAGTAPYPPVGEHPPLNLDTQSQRHCRLRGSGRCPPAPVSYAAFVPLLQQAAQHQDTFAVLQPLVPVFEDLAARYADLLLWQYVFLPDKGQGVFPATDLRAWHTEQALMSQHMDSVAHHDIPESSMHMHDTMLRLGMSPDWYLQAMRSKAPVWGNPHADPLTRKTVITVSMLVRDAQGEPSAGTALVVEVGSLLRVDDHLASLSDELETLVVMPDSAPADASQEERIRILARQGEDEQTTLLEGTNRALRSWRASEQEEWLRSSDTKTLAAVAADLRAGRSGLRTLSHKGRECLWAYGNIEAGGLSLLIIAPKQDLVTEAENTQHYVLRRFKRAIVASGIIMSVVLACIIALAMVLSKRLTRRIEDLAHGFERVGQGDFSVRVRTHTRDEIGRLGQGFNTMVPALEERLQMRQALEVAHEIQRSLLPHEVPLVNGFQLAGRSVYSETTGGDYFDFIAKSGDNESLGLAVGDVTGHGLPAAMLMTTARAFLRQRATMPGGPGQVLADVNRLLSSDVDQSGRFMTLFYAVLEPESKTLRWARAGHDPALLYSPLDGSFRDLAGDGLPLGTLPDWEFEEQQLSLEPGHVLCIATDGIWETTNATGEMYGKERLREIIRAQAQEPPADILKALLRDLRTFRGSDEFEDDVTIVLLKAL